MPQQTITFSTDGNFAIHVTDLIKTENFYSNVLGFKMLQKTNEQMRNLYRIPANLHFTIIGTIRLSQFLRFKLTTVKLQSNTQLTAAVK